MSYVDTSNGARRGNKRWPEALKREIVAATLKPGASVSVVARQYDVNANQVFMRLRRYGDTAAQSVSPSPPATPALAPVTITPAAEAEAAPPSEAGASDTIVIEVPDGYRVRVGAGFDVRTLKRVLDMLSRAGGAREKSR
jgi:transposase